MAPKINVVIDRDLLLEELYHIRSFVSPEQEELKQAIMGVIDLIVKAPTDERKSSYPKIKGR